MYFYLSSLPVSWLRTVGFAFAAAAVTVGELHVMSSMANVQVFSSLTLLVIFSRVNICANLHQLFVQTLSLLDPFIQMIVSFPPTVTFGGRGAPSGFFSDLKYGIFSQMKIPLSLWGLSLFVLCESPPVKREFQRSWPPLLDSPNPPLDPPPLRLLVLASSFLFLSEPLLLVAATAGYSVIYNWGILWKLNISCCMMALCRFCRKNSIRWNASCRSEFLSSIMGPSSKFNSLMSGSPAARANFAMIRCTLTRIANPICLCPLDLCCQSRPAVETSFG